MKTEHWFKPPSLGMVPAVVTPQDTGNALPVSGLATKMAANRLRHSQLVKNGRPRALGSLEEVQDTAAL